MCRPLRKINCWSSSRAAIGCNVGLGRRPAKLYIQARIVRTCEVRYDGVEGYNGHRNESGERQAWNCSESKLARFLVVVQTLSEPPTVTVHGAYARFHMFDFCQHSYDDMSYYRRMNRMSQSHRDIQNGYKRGAYRQAVTSKCPKQRCAGITIGVPIPSNSLWIIPIPIQFPFPVQYLILILTIQTFLLPSPPITILNACNNYI